MHLRATAKILVGFLSVVGFPTLIQAQTKPGAGGEAARAESERLGKDGERLLSQHDAQGAIEPLAKAYNLSNNPRFLLPLGLAYAEAERPLDALDALGRFLKDSPSVPDAKRREIGTKFAVMLDQVAALVTLEASRQNAPIKIDGRPVGMSPIQTPLRLMPGKHEIVMQPAPTDPSSGARQVIEVKPGERRTVKLEPGAPSRFLEPQAQGMPVQGNYGDQPTEQAAGTSGLKTQHASSTETPLWSNWKLWAGVGGGVVAVLAIGLGAGLGARAHNNATASDEFPTVPSWPGGPIDGRPATLVAVAGFSR